MAYQVDYSPIMQGAQAQSQALQGLGQSVGGAIGNYRQQQQQEEQKKAQQVQFKMGQDVLKNGTPTEIASFMVANPAMAKGLESAFAWKNDLTKENAAETGFAIINGMDPIEAINKRIKVIDSSGGDSGQARNMLTKTPEEQMRYARLMASQATPDQLKAFESTRQGGEQAKGMTAYQTERLKLDEKSLKIRERESDLRQEDNVNKRKSLENRIKKETMALQEQELKFIADNKGGSAQKMLRDANEGDKLSLTFARRMTDSSKTLSELDNIIDPTNRVIGFIAGSRGMTSEVANRMASKEEQSYAAAASDYVTAQLRKESGAAIGVDEFDRKYRELFPMPGDKPDQIKLKRERREAAALDMQNLSGGLYDEFYGEGSQPQQAQPAQAQQQQQPAAQQMPPTNQQGWGLMVDGSGNRAYVGPNGEIQEVQ